MKWVECWDGSFVYEYMKPNWRFGLSLEKDPKESGWFFVYVGSRKPILKSGLMGTTIHRVMYRLFISWRKP